MIGGDRVRLRPFRAEDLPAMRGWFDDPEVMRHWAMPTAPVLPDQFAADLSGRFARFEEAGYFAVEATDGPAPALIGRIEYERLDPVARSAEVMILLGDKSSWGKGYGTDAMVALLRYLFHARNLHRAALSVLAWNERAIRSYEKVGFVREGRLRDDAYFDGRYHDQVVMGILRSEFDARWGAPERPADPAAGLPGIDGAGQGDPETAGGVARG